MSFSSNESASKSGIISSAHPKTIIGICSAVTNLERRSAVRETWIKTLSPEMVPLFFVGSGVQTDEKDVVQLPVPDDYDHLPMKVQAFFRYILDNYEFDYAFKCDDDTYLWGDRLSEFRKSITVEFVGSAKLTRLWTQGGAGYLMTRKMVETIVDTNFPEEGAEDMIVSQIVKDSGKSYLSSDLLRPYSDVWPHHCNDYITAHHCSPSTLRYIHSWIFEPHEFDVVASYFAYHTDWAGSLTLRKNGTFCLDHSRHASGNWDISSPGNKLILRWFRWPVQYLSPHSEGGYESKNLRLIRAHAGKSHPLAGHLVVFTRVCLDDFSIFKIWVEYHSRRYPDIRCCIFQRPEDDIAGIIAFCEEKNIAYNVLKGEVFDNRPTFDILSELAANESGRIALVIDCDEFVSDFEKLERAVLNMPADSIILKMVDRISVDIFYDIENCRTYEDLCNVAPLSANITKTVQKWSDEKCCVNTLPDLGWLHTPAPGKSSLLVEHVYLNHFKWRTEWLPKAKRRLQEVRELGYSWQTGLSRAVKILDDTRPKRYLSISGPFDFENLYEEQCQRLENDSRIVEAGVGDGKSVAFLIERGRSLGKEFKVFGVDPFRGVEKFKPDPKHAAMEITRRNLEQRGLADAVELIKASTGEAAHYFENESLDFVWLDGSQTAREMTINIVAWWPKIKTGGTIGGRELPFHGVAEALDHLGVPYVQDGRSWIVRNISLNRKKLVVPL